TVMSGPWNEEETKVRYLLVDGIKLDFEEKKKEDKADKPESGTKKKAEPESVDLAGDWGVEIQSAQGKVIGQLQLAQDKTSLRGTFSSEKGDGKVTSGKIEKAQFEFTVAIGA